MNKKVIGIVGGVAALGAFLLYRLGKKTAAALDPTTAAVAEALSPELAAALEDKQVTAQAAQETAQSASAQVMADTSALAAAEQRMYQLQNALNAALANQSAGNNAAAQNMEAERQAWETKIKELEARIAQGTSTVQTAQQVAQSNLQQAATITQRVQEAVTQEFKAQGEKASAAAEAMRQEAATGSSKVADPTAKFAELGNYLQSTLAEAMKRAGSPKDKQGYIDQWFKTLNGYEAKYGANFMTYFKANYGAVLASANTFAAQVAAAVANATLTSTPSAEAKWADGAMWLESLWKNNYPQLKTDAERVQFFVDFENRVAEAEKQYPGFNGWFAANKAAMINAMTAEKLKVKAAVEASSKQNQALNVWKTIATGYMNSWKSEYPRLATNELKLKWLVEVYNNAQATDKKYPGFMAWFDKNYPGVVAQMTAERNRVDQEIARSKVSKSAPGAKTTTTSASTPDPTAPLKADYQTNVVLWWAKHKTMPTPATQLQSMKGHLGWRATPTGAAAWRYAAQVNASLVAEIEKEHTRLKLFAQRSGQFLAGLTGVDDSISRARMLRDAAKIMHADTALIAKRNRVITNAMR
jgi:hypothetical protein